MVNRRRRRALGCAPVDRIAADTAAMLPLPPVPPATGWRLSGRLPRDYYVRLDSNDYSMHPSVIGRRIEVIADLDRVRAFCDGRVVADHSGLGQTSEPDPARACRGGQAAAAGADRHGPPCAEPEVEIRCLADYDTALGLDDSTAAVA